MKKYIATLASLALVIGLGGCLMSLTESFEYDVFFEHGLTEIDLTGKDGHEEEVDFTTDDTFNDNKDKIKNVDRVEFNIAMYTDNGEAAIMDVAFREPIDDSVTPPLEENDWVPLLVDVPVPAGASDTSPHTISYEDSLDYIVNFETLQKVAEGGWIDLRFTTDTGNDQVIITKLVLYVAISAAK